MDLGPTDRTPPESFGNRGSRDLYLWLPLPWGDHMKLEDVQNRRDDRQLALDQAGVSDIRHPIVVLDRDHQKQPTVATIAMSVSLPDHFKGTHMSRFIEVLSSH